MNHSKSAINKSKGEIIGSEMQLPSLITSKKEVVTRY